ncbi:hypothetical protein AB5I41_14080 [Sphingomonas sp. MMS24-JH45]
MAASPSRSQKQALPGTSAMGRYWRSDYRDGIELPRRRAKVIAMTAGALAEATSDRDRLSLMEQLVGRTSEAAEVDPRWLGRKVMIVAERRD